MSRHLPRPYRVPLAVILALAMLAGADSGRASQQVTKKVRKVGIRIKDLGKKVGKKVGRGTAGGFRTIKGNIQRYLDSHDDGDLAEGEVTGFLSRIGIGGKRTYAAAPGAQRFSVASYEGDWGWPLDQGVVSSEYGRRSRGRHYGIDIAADRGAPVYAAAAGRVVYSGDGMSGYGNVVILRHDQHTTTLYAHNQRNLVKVGDELERGDELARLGSTGRSTGPHVHFEIRTDEHALDPRTCLPPVVDGD